MPAPTYVNFDLQLAPGPNGLFARVLDSPAGQAVGEFRSPLSDEDLAEFVTQLLQSSNRQSRLFEQGLLRAVGAQLFDALFQGELYACLTRSLDAAERQGAGLRIRLRLNDAPALVNLPWEYLHFAAGNRFLSLSVASPLVHYLELPQPVSPLSVTPPVGILGVIAAPVDLPPLDAEQEWGRLETALADLTQQNEAALFRLQNPTLADLQRALRQHTVHVIHFIGHGLYDGANREGKLAFCDANGQAELVGATQLAQLLRNERTLRLVLLNACEGSRTAVDDAFAGIAQTLVQQGIPAVIAMQFPISDQAAITFADEFYTALADGYPVDAALTEARVAISTRQRGGEWGAARLFMRAGDGMLWQRATNQITPTTRVDVGERLGVLPGLMQSGAVRSRVATFRADFEAACQQIDLLVQYKDLHDLLHKLQFRCYNVILQEAPRFPDDALSVDNLLNYEVTLQDLLAQLRGLAARPLISGAELGWVDDVGQAQGLLHQALTQLDATPLKRAILLLKRVIALQPSGVNQRLAAAARALRLGALVEAMRAIHAALGELALDQDKVRQFEQGVTALRSLDAQLMALIDAHDQWQAVERMLGRIEDVMVYDLTELELSWPDVRTRVTTLANAGAEEWVTLLNEDAANLDGALTAQNPSMIQRYFRRYRQRAGNRFYQVDTMLKNLCEELRHVGEPLASVLRILE